MAVIESSVRPRATTTLLEPGDAIEVQNRFMETWCAGFEVSEVISDPICTHYRIRRTSDGMIIPDLFGETHVRPRR